jgi:putative protease
VKTVELLAPAGSPEALDAAISEGADAVYLGLKTFNARLRTSNFAYSQFEAAVEALHKLGKKIYVTVNTVFEEREADRMYQHLQYLERVGPNGIIVQDFGVARLAREHFPGLKLHASTQMNVASSRGANVLSKMGFNRVVLARELSLPEIGAIHQGSNLELEFFVHGALCMSYSGLCLFSSFLGGKSANRGACTQACRRIYQTEDSSGYYFSPNDLELIEHVPELIEAGVSSFKIEGRMKSAEYVGTVVEAYRYLIDHYESEPEGSLAKARSILKNDFARAKTSYFIGSEYPDFLDPNQAGGTGISLGRVKELRTFNDDAFALCERLVNRGPDAPQVSPGDSVRIHSSNDEKRVTTRVKELIPKEEGLYLSFQAPVKQGDNLYLIQTKAMTRRYRSLLPNSLDRYRRLPSHDAAPQETPPSGNKELWEKLPAGFYAMTDSVASLYIFQATPPTKAILRITRKSAADLFEAGEGAPFKRDKLIAYLEPFFPESDDAWLSETVEALIKRGVNTFIVNNLAHISLLKNRGLTLVAGDYLYAFNSYAAVEALGLGCSALIPPLEISKQDLFKIAETVPASLFFMTIFTFPALFRIKAKPDAQSQLHYFMAREGEDYEFSRSSGNAVVIPQTPVSLTDRCEVLEKAGFKRFIVDFSYIELKKPLYKQVMNAAQHNDVLPGAGRFNWKLGFWNPDESTLSDNRFAAKPKAGDAEASSGSASPRGEFKRRPGGKVPGGKGFGGKSFGGNKPEGGRPFGNKGADRPDSGFKKRNPSRGPGTPGRLGKPSRGKPSGEKGGPDGARPSGGKPPRAK